MSSSSWKIAVKATLKRMYEENKRCGILISSVDNIFEIDKYVSMEHFREHLGSLKSGLYDINIMIQNKPITYDHRVISDIRVAILNGGGKKIFVDKIRWSEDMLLAELHRIRDIKLYLK